MKCPPYPSLTAVVHGMVKAAPSGLDARTVADLVGKPYPTLMSELSQQPGHKLGAELLLPLMDVCESDLPLVFLARQRGGAFVPLRIPDGRVLCLKNCMQSPRPLSRQPAIWCACVACRPSA